MSLENEPRDCRFYDQRLMRIEEKIDNLAEVLISVARAEEKISAMEEDRTIQWEKLNHMEAKIDIMEEKVRDAAKTVSVIHKLFWVAGAATVSYFVPGIVQTLGL